jgi:hypothetical protein
MGRDYRRSWLARHHTRRKMANCNIEYATTCALLYRRDKANIWNTKKRQDPLWPPSPLS